MNASDGHFFKPGCRHLVEFSQHMRQRNAASNTPRRRDDAVGAGFVTAGLYAQRIASPTGGAWLNCLATRTVSFTEPLAGWILMLEFETSY
jgi:hypothetical protein